MADRNEEILNPEPNRDLETLQRKEKKEERREREERIREQERKERQGTSSAHTL
jgi:hypothetical protein